MVFSPDFLLYFAQLAHLYEADPTIYCISSWNDNGKKDLAYDPSGLYRTEFFIGLGWLASRKIYKTEWEAKWPNQHWDHFLRRPEQRKGRECVYPEVSRNYNIGSKGVHMDSKLFAKYFERTVVNDKPRVSLGDTSRLIQSRYESDLRQELKHATAAASIAALKQFRNTSLVVFVDVKSSQDRQWEDVVAPFFGLWHSIPYIRGMHNGVIQFRWYTNHVSLVCAFSPYASLRSEKGAPLITPAQFPLQDAMDLDEIVTVQAAPQTSCDEACKMLNPRFECDPKALAAINDCEVLRSSFSGLCQQCERNIGDDQPAVISAASEGDRVGVCLVHSKPKDLTCSNSHPVTSRLCACFEPQNI